MKNKNKKNYLLWILLSTLMIVWIINITNWQTTIDTNPDSSKLHTPSLFSLFLWDNSDYTNIKIKTWEVYLDILNWLVVGKLEWKGNMISWATLSVIWWWNGNMINSNNAWIGGWYWNQIIAWEYWAIWWWSQNKILINNNTNNWIIVWWSSNTDNGWWIILWGELNQISNNKIWWIILWWKNNLAWINSLVLWSNSIWWEYSFVRNLNNKNNKNARESDTDYSARINTTGWMLINTLSPVKWVSLIVSWAINYGNKFKYNNTWWIYFNPDWCMKFFDWNVHKTLGKASIYTNCSNDESWCQFGAITLNNWDIMTAYSVSYTGNCQNASGQVTCINWEMVDNNNKSDVYVYPYCYNLSDDPIIQVEKWYQNCTRKPNHSHWTNPHFIQTLNTSTNKYEPENRNAVYDPTGSNDCSFDCDTNYTYSWNKCEWDTKRIDCDIPNELNINNIDWYFSPQYPATRGGIDRASLNHETKKYSPGDTVYCKYVCKSGYTGEYCNETINYTCENKPSWSGYIFWSGTYTTWYTPTSWSYTGNSILNSCQYTCDTENGYNWNNNKCEKETEPIAYLEIWFNIRGRISNVLSVSDGTYEISGYDRAGFPIYNYHFKNFKRRTASKPQWVETYTPPTDSTVAKIQVISEETSPREVIIWYDSGDQTIYYYTDAEEIYMNPDSYDLFDFDRDRKELWNLENIDLSDWDSSKVTNMEMMFYWCPNLKHIYVSEKFKTDKVSNSKNMFTDVKKIIWWQWTTYSSSHIDKEYARIDCWPGKPGYFSTKDGNYSSCNQQLSCKYETKNDQTYMVLNQCEGEIEASNSKSNKTSTWTIYTRNCGTTQCSTFRTDMCWTYNWSINSKYLCKNNSSLFKSWYYNNNSTITWRCQKNWEPIAYCGCNNINHEDRCKDYWEAYVRDENINGCKFSPRFCMILYSGNKAYYPHWDALYIHPAEELYRCFGNFYDEAKNAENIYAHTTSITATSDELYIDEPQTRAKFNIDVWNTGFLFVGGWWSYYSYPLISLDNIDWLDNQINGRFTNYIKNKKCELISPNQDAWSRLDCSMNSNDYYPWEIQPWKKIVNSYPYCYY